MKSVLCIYTLVLLGTVVSVLGVHVDPAITNSPTPLCACHCNCGADRPQSAATLEWKRVFKAVAGNGRNVLNDFTSGGDINGDVSDAKLIESSMPFRDAEVLDRWTQLGVEKVKVEVFDEGVRQSWFVFDGKDSDLNSWFSRDRLLDSPYADIKSGPFNFFSIEGDSTVNRRFYINRKYGGCPRDCGFLDIVDTDAPKRVCRFDKRGEYPYFLYGKEMDTCSNKENTSQTGKGDRFVVSVQLGTPRDC